MHFFMHACWSLQSPKLACLQERDGCEGEKGKYLLNISVTRSISASAAAIFSAEEGWGRPNPPNIDIFAIFSFESERDFDIVSLGERVAV
jgi:hypothetical protein